MTLLLIRHGETQWNIELSYQGRFDSPLTTRGIAQAEAAARRLAALPEIAAAQVVASPLGRARRTAEIVVAPLSDKAIRLDHRLREHSLGSWDGLSHDEIMSRACQIFAGRVADCLSETTEAQVLVVVTHGMVSRILRSLYAGLPRADALSLPVPQDKLFRLSGGGIEEIPF